MMVLLFQNHEASSNPMSASCSRKIPDGRIFLADRQAYESYLYA